MAKVIFLGSKVTIVGSVPIEQDPQQPTARAT
jgi:hypothetical protein